MDDMVQKHSKQISNVTAQNLVEPLPPEDIARNVHNVTPSSDGLTILVCSTGSVATIKLPQILAQLKSTVSNLNLEVVLTEKAKHFCTPDPKTIPQVSVYSDSEWNFEKTPLLADELAKRANLMLIAPLDANSLAKIANGICDNLLTSIARIWDLKNKVAICCPAMNTQMWIHPITEVHIKQVESLGFIVIPPITKKLACGDYGVGAMAEPHSIVSEVKRYAKFNGKKCNFENSAVTEENSANEVTNYQICC